MPFANLSNAKIHYALSGDPSHPPLILSNSLGADFSMWDAQTPAFEKRFRLLRYDTRGHGQSSSPPSPYSVPELVDDLLALADSVAFSQFHLCGLSLGGMIGMSIALNFPARLKKLVLCNTAAKIGTQQSWNTRIELVRSKGMKEIAKATPARWFSSAFQSSSPQLVASALRAMEAQTPDGYIGGCCAVRDFDARNAVSRIHVATLVLSGTHDPATPPADGQFLAQQIPGAQYVEVSASHLSSVEAPDRVTNEVLSFLA
jgi:3-oxoadipate enol-lactonase